MTILSIAFIVLNALCAVVGFLEGNFIMAMVNAAVMAFLVSMHE